ncbi:MAG: DUF2207 domain-containing protein [Candidatus Nanopelagicales bacterium]
MDFLWVLGVAVALGTAAYRWRPARVIAIVIAVFCALGAALVQQLDWSSSGGGSSDTSIIRNYQADYDITADGAMTLVETLDVEFTETKRGIFRFFDESDGVDDDVTHPVTVESVQRCGTTELAKCADEPFETYYEEGYLVAKIGSATKPYPPGTVNRYVITSTARNVITRPEGSAVDQWYWNVVAQGWAMPIRNAEISVTFPVPATEVRCITDTGPCETKQARDPNVVTGTYASLPPRTPVTWQADLSPADLTVVIVTPPAADSGSWWRGAWLLIPAAVLAVLFFLFIRTLQERPASEAPVFAAPSKDILPTVWTYREEAPEHSFQTMLLYLQQEDAVRVEVPQDGQYMSTKPEWIRIWRTDKPLPMVTGAAEFVSGMGISQPGSTAVIAKNDAAIGKAIQSTEKTLTSLTNKYAQAMGYYRASGAGVLANVLAAALPLLSIGVSLLFGQWWLGLALLLPAVAGVWAQRSMRTRLSEYGLKVRDQVNGLHTALSTRASVERFDYARKVRYFAQFLPWAVALDCADTWAKACKPDFPPDDPRWTEDASLMSAWSVYSGSQAISSAVASVSSGAIASYAATQSSSGSGGGGGFSSGGGSGGGGGGSW